MTEALFHFLVPLTIIRLVTLFYYIDKKLIVILSTFALVPDVDFFIIHHRALTHNLFFGALLVALAVIFLKKYFNKYHIIIIGSFFFLSHIVLDGYLVAWFYPIQQFHYNPFTGATASLQAMDSMKPNYPLSYFLAAIGLVIFIYSILIYESYFRNKNVKIFKR